MAYMYWGLAVTEVKYEVEETSWLIEYQIAYSPWYVKYFKSFYFSTTTMTTLGFGDIVPKTNSEIYYVILAMMISSAFFAYVLNFIGNIIIEQNREQQHYKKQLTLLNKYLSKKNIDTALGNETRNHLSYLLRNTQEINQEEQSEVFNSLSDSLKERITINSNVKVLQKIKQFKGFSQRTLEKLALQVQENIYRQNDIIYWEKDIEQNPTLYYIEKGQVEIFIDTYKGDQEQTTFAKKGPTQSFGTYSFFTSLERKVCVRALDHTVLLQLSRYDALEIIKENQEDYERFCMLQDGLIFRNNIEHYKCQVCSSKDHLQYDCPQLHFIPDYTKVVLHYIHPNNNIIEDREFKQRNEYVLFNALSDRRKIKRQVKKFMKQVMQELYFSYNPLESLDSFLETSNFITSQNINGGQKFVEDSYQLTHVTSSSDSSDYYNNNDDELPVIHEHRESSLTDIKDLQSQKRLSSIKRKSYMSVNKKERKSSFAAEHNRNRNGMHYLQSDIQEEDEIDLSKTLQSRIKSGSLRIDIPENDANKESYNQQPQAQEIGLKINPKLLQSYIISGEDDQEQRGTPKVSNEREIINPENIHNIFRNSSQRNTNSISLLNQSQQTQNNQNNQNNQSQQRMSRTKKQSEDQLLPLNKKNSVQNIQKKYNKRNSQLRFGIPFNVDKKNSTIENRQKDRQASLKRGQLYQQSGLFHPPNSATSTSGNYLQSPGLIQKSQQLEKSNELKARRQNSVMQKQQKQQRMQNMWSHTSPYQLMQHNQSTKASYMDQSEQNSQLMMLQKNPSLMHGHSSHGHGHKKNNTILSQYSNHWNEMSMHQQSQISSQSIKNPLGMLNSNQGVFPTLVRNQTSHMSNGFNGYLPQMNYGQVPRRNSVLQQGMSRQMMKLQAMENVSANLDNDHHISKTMSVAGYMSVQEELGYQSDDEQKIQHFSINEDPLQCTVYYPDDNYNMDKMIKNFNLYSDYRYPVSFGVYTFYNRKQQYYPRKSLKNKLHKINKKKQSVQMIQKLINGHKSADTTGGKRSYDFNAYKQQQQNLDGSYLRTSTTNNHNNQNLRQSNNNLRKNTRIINNK